MLDGRTDLNAKASTVAPSMVDEEENLAPASDRGRPVDPGRDSVRISSTVGKVLLRHDHSRLPREPRAGSALRTRAGGELVHLDTKKLGRSWQVGKRNLGDVVRGDPDGSCQHRHITWTSTPAWIGGDRARTGETMRSPTLTLSWTDSPTGISRSRRG